MKILFNHPNISKQTWVGPASGRWYKFVSGRVFEVDSADLRAWSGMTFKGAPIFEKIEPDGPGDPGELTAQEAIARIPDLTLEEVNAWGIMEAEGKKRKTVLAVLAAAYEEKVGGEPV